MPFYITDQVENEDDDCEAVYKLISSPMIRTCSNDMEENYRIANNFIDKMFEYINYYVK